MKVLMLGWVVKHFLSFFAVFAKIRVSKDEQTKRKKKMHTDFWRDLHGEAAVGEYLLSNLWS